MAVNEVIHGDCLDVMRGMPDKCVDLVFCSPPYESARTYGINFKLRGQDWVDWCVVRYMECLRVCKGLVAWVVEGQTRQFRYSATPALLMADLHRRGVHLRKPPIFHRVGIPGSGGPDWVRNDYEFIVCAGPGGKLPWSDNTAMGHPPKWAPGGEMANRLSNGTRVNQWGRVGGPRGMGNVSADGKAESTKRPSHVHTKRDGSQVIRENRKVVTVPRDGQHDNSQSYTVPVLANPGNVIKCKVGGGVMGSPLSSLNEAPFPSDLAAFFVRSFCPPGGTVLDPFSGSGTTAAVAERWGRKWIAIDVRDSQVKLTKKRVAKNGRPLFQESTP